MKNKLTLKTLAVLGLAIIMGSCSTSNEVASNKIITKRKVNSGFHINWPSNWKSSDADQDVAVKEIKREAKTEVVAETKRTVEVSTPVVETAVESTSTADMVSDAVVETPAVENSVVETPAVEKTVVNKATEKAVAKELKKEFKKAVKASKKQSSSSDVPVGLLYVLAIFIPFLAVGLVTDWDLKPVLINILLSMLCGIPGIIHAIVVVSKNK